MKRYIAEGIGTYALVFCGTGAIIINEVSGGAVTHLGIAITFGLIVTVMIYAFGSISGTHINPAVSIGFALANCFDKKSIFPYAIAQLIGGLFASLTLYVMFPENEYLGGTQPTGSAWQSFILEIILTYFLMLVILLVSQSEKTVNQFTAIAVGSTVLLEALFAGPISGASMNPVRSIAPALVSGHLEHLWIYLVAPIVGAIFATYTWLYFQKTENPPFNKV